MNFGENFTSVLTQQCSSTSNASKIKTLAFFDLEATGIPALEFNKTKITELTIVACSVEHMIQAKASDIPRVCHKLSLCFNPFKLISHKSSEITGLTNELLEHENKFDKNALNLVECFLFKLQQPVCLVAHNGKKFDFPLLKTQFEFHDGSFPFSLKCCDSLEVFQKLDQQQEEKYEILSQNYSLEWMWNNSRNNESLNNDEKGLFKSRYLNSSENDNEIDEVFKKMVEDELNKIREKESQDEDSSEGAISLMKQKINETTPENRTNPINTQPYHSNNFGVKSNASTSLKRKFFTQEQSNTQQWTRGKYTLRAIHKRMLGFYPNKIHSSESDVLSLMACVNTCKNDFIRILNEISIDFSDVKKL
ncbi:CLUMA_CG021381, isoform A [Clunio marinus]|uniref:CLUMA_CG021381, isoform A n=1 Tax=Clunio marinus TaxID=568069 RepID=A0A1J1J8X3_9DIPT|nr:CLUMA_CG021381, isoform A [Clunio marinus]